VTVRQIELAAGIPLPEVPEPCQAALASLFRPQAMQIDLRIWQGMLQEEKKSRAVGVKDAEPTAGIANG
jgi:hypothetical protein